MKRGFTLVEMLVSMIIAAILVLVVGVLSSIANGTFNKLNKKQAIYNDISYGFKLMQNRMRGSLNSVRIVPKLDPPWMNGELLAADNGGFGLYRTAGETRIDFVYLEDKSDETNRETIFTVPEGTLGWSITCRSTNPVNPTDCDTGVISVTITLTGTKDKIPFSLATTILRRNT